MTTHNTESKSAQADFAAEGHPGANSFAGHPACLAPVFTVDAPNRE